VQTGNNKADAVTSWPNASAVVSYGANNDLWGTAWTYSDINAANFGFAIIGRSAAAGTALQVDYVTIEVY